MSTYRLNTLFAPRSVAVVGASPREKSTGRAALRNLQRGDFQGDIHLVNPSYDAIDGIHAVKSYEQLTDTPDIGVIAAPPQAVPGIVAAAAAKGRCCIILTAGLGHGQETLAGQCESAARAVGMRLVGPNCLGVQVPGVKLNASFASMRTGRSRPDLAIRCDRCRTCGMGSGSRHRIFGRRFDRRQLDVDLGDLLDFFALDQATRAILLYVEWIRDARKFMSAARAAARTKPVVVIKAGRHPQAPKRP